MNYQNDIKIPLMYRICLFYGTTYLISMLLFFQNNSAYHYQFSPGKKQKCSSPSCVSRKLIVLFFFFFYRNKISLIQNKAWFHAWVWQMLVMIVLGWNEGEAGKTLHVRKKLGFCREHKVSTLNYSFFIHFLLIVTSFESRSNLASKEAVTQWENNRIPLQYVQLSVEI